MPAKQPQSFSRFNTMLADLDGVTSKTQKTSTVAEHIHDGTVAALVLLAESPFVRFGVKKLKLPKDFAANDDEPKPFFDLAEALRLRALTGGEAQTAITRTLSRYTEETAENLAKVLRKNLKVSVGASIINKAAGYELVKEYDVMLADKMSEKFDKHGAPWFVEYKYDGMRLIAEVENYVVTFFSRNGLEQEYVPQHIIDSILEQSKAYGGNCIFDGEVYGHSNEDGVTGYTYTMRAMKSAENDSANLRFVAFDFMTLDEWRDQSCPHPLMVRRANLAKLVKADGGKGLTLSIGQRCDTYDELEVFYAKLVNDGAEGAIIKKLNSLYSWKRCKDWTKYKPVYTADLEAYEVYEGEEDSEFVGTLGGVRLRGTLEDGTYVECDCGSGFRLKRDKGYDQPTRDEIWKNPKLILGKTLEVEYQEVTQAQNKQHKSLRFVVFKHIRNDK